MNPEFHCSGQMILGVPAFAAMLGLPAESISAASHGLIEEAALAYEELIGERRDMAILGALQVLESERLKTAGNHRKDDWEAGWSQNLQAFSSSKDPMALRPRYFRPDPVLRINRTYVRPGRPDLLPRFHALYCRLVFERYLAGMPAIWEFGCGTGHNLVALAGLFPDTPITGLDWASSAIELVRSIGERYPNIEGRSFDLFHPDRARKLPARAAVMTIHALEQLGDGFGPFLGYLLENRPSRCVHIEPILELYDEGNLLDHLAIRYHRRRNYLEGFLPALKDLEEQGRIVLEQVRRAFVGSEFDEGYTLIVWRPR